jgi:hypothetical protein
MNIEIYGWMALPKETKEKLAGVFHIPKRGTVHVSDGQIVEDGYMKEDLVQCLNLEAMQKYSKSKKADFIGLLTACVRRVEKGETDGTDATTGDATVPSV